MARKFVASYSGGKDSVLAIYRAIQQGLEPVALITTYNTDRGRSWFHGIPASTLDRVSESLGMPIWLIRTSGEDYAANFENTLRLAKDMGADACVFGDIDIEDHRIWCRERCHTAGLEAIFPLWGEERKTLVHAFIDSGFTATLTVVDTKRLDRTFLGRQLTRELVEKIALTGADACGENGEYHSFVSAGPLFRHPVHVRFGNRIEEKGYAILTIE